MNKEKETTDGPEKAPYSVNNHSDRITFNVRGYRTLELIQVNKRYGVVTWEYGARDHEAEPDGWKAATNFRDALNAAIDVSGDTRTGLMEQKELEKTYRIAPLVWECPDTGIDGESLEARAGLVDFKLSRSIYGNKSSAWRLSRRWRGEETYREGQEVSSLQAGKNTATKMLRGMLQQALIPCEANDKDQPMDSNEG